MVSIFSVLRVSVFWQKNLRLLCWQFAFKTVYTWCLLSVITSLVATMVEKPNVKMIEKHAVAKLEIPANQNQLKLIKKRIDFRFLGPQGLPWLARQLGPSDTPQTPSRHTCTPPRHPQTVPWHSLDATEILPTYPPDTPKQSTEAHQTIPRHSPETLRTPPRHPQTLPRHWLTLITLANSG